MKEAAKQAGQAFNWQNVIESAPVNDVSVNGLSLALTGMVIVFVALTSIAIFIACMPSILKVVNEILPPAGPHIPHRKAKPASAQPATTDDDTQLAVAIATAYHKSQGGA